MGWDLDTLPQRLQNVTLSTQQVPIDSSSCIDSQDFNRAANFTDIISSELVLICIAGYLPVPSLLSLSSTTKDIRAVMHSTPGVWRTCDFTHFLESSQDCSQKNLVKFLRQHYVSRDCRVLILDGLAFDHQFLDNLLLREMPALHSISLLSCPDLNGDQLIKLIDYIRRPSAPRPLTLKHMAVLGAPLFALNQASRFAPAIVAAAGDEIHTDLHGLQCLGEEHREADEREGKWHLKVQYPNHPCTLCSIQQDVCMKCHVKQSCVGCHSFYCDDCEPYPSKLTVDCHECGRLCERCRGGVMLKCTWCSGFFCSIHEPLKPGGKILCDWCRNAGRRTRELY